MKEIAIEEALKELKRIHLPPREELPSIPLYMDQVIMYLNGVLGKGGDKQSAPLTKMMINNYAK
ncbi:MAG: DUF1836 domain-containing protein, partial [Lachnospiraceae bacterium]|nr:DUF1836 domain-containing protein [Lachnospiraceae bacterium]